MARRRRAAEWILTFFLSCWLACAVCIGLSVGIVAGIAYGYNYCLAEFIVLTRSDVQVYMRRGQFYDKPDLLFQNSRRGGDDEEAFPSDFIDENHQEVPSGNDSPTTQWERDQDIRKYAEKLTKYSDKYTKNNIVDENQNYRYYHPDDSSGDGVQNQASQKTFVDADQQVTESNEYQKLTLLPARRVPIFSNSIIPTMVIHSGSSQIVMRKFDPVVVPEPDEVVEYDDKYLKVLAKETHAGVPLEEMERKTVAFTPDMRIRLEDSSTRKLIKMRHWGTSTKPIILGYSNEVDEDNLVYKAV